MTTAEKILEGIKNLTTKHEYIRVGCVQSVDVDNNICVCEFENITDEVRLKSAKDGANGIISVPKVGSNVFIGRFQDEHFILMCDEIDKYLIKLNGITFEISNDSNGILKLNGDGNGGLVIIQNLINKMNALEDAYNNFLTEYKSHIHPYMNVSTPATTSATTSTQNIIQKTQKSDLENTKVVHG